MSNYDLQSVSTIPARLLNAPATLTEHAMREAGSPQSSRRSQSSLRFLFGGRPVSVTGVDPTCSVLRWLSEEAGRTGTKEGCAEGDCGACTVVVGELVDGELELKAVNACIQFLPTLDGKALFTVEDLRRGDGALHPVQQAMVDCH